MNGFSSRRPTRGGGSRSARPRGNGTSVSQNGSVKVRDRLTFVQLNLVGRTVVVKKTNGVQLKGIFVGSSLKSTLWEGCTLKFVQLLEKPADVTIPKFDAMEGVRIKWDEIAFIFAENARDTTAHVVNSDQIKTDSDISRQAVRGGKVAGRALQAADSSWLEAPKRVSSDMSSRGGAAWDQFEVNKEKFGVKSTYDENLYTTRLNKTDLTKEQIAKAEKTASEIMRQTSSNPHLMEERGKASAWNGDEEERYSAVVRKNEPKITSDTGNLQKAEQKVQSSEVLPVEKSNAAKESKVDKKAVAAKPLSFAAAVKGKSAQPSGEAAKKNPNPDLSNDVSKPASSKARLPTKSPKREKTNQSKLGKQKPMSRSDEIAELQEFRRQLEDKEKKKKSDRSAGTKKEKQERKQSAKSKGLDANAKEWKPNVNAKEWKPATSDNPPVMQFASVPPMPVQMQPQMYHGGMVPQFFPPTMQPHIMPMQPPMVQYTGYLPPGAAPMAPYGRGQPAPNPGVMPGQMPPSLGQQGAPRGRGSGQREPDSKRK